MTIGDAKKYAAEAKAEWVQPQGVISPAVAPLINAVEALVAEGEALRADLERMDRRAGERLATLEGGLLALEVATANRLAALEARAAPVVEPVPLRPDQCPACRWSPISLDNGLDGACPCVAGDDGKGGCPDPLAWRRKHGYGRGWDPLAALAPVAPSACREDCMGTCARRVDPHSVLRPSECEKTWICSTHGTAHKQATATVEETIAPVLADGWPNDGYRYRAIDTKRGRLILRDDGYRVRFQLLSKAVNIDPDEWHHWAEYRHCDLPGPAAEIADAVMLAAPPAPAFVLSDKERVALRLEREYPHDPESASTTIFRLVTRLAAHAGVRLDGEEQR